MATLEHFPLVSQLTEITSDSMPSNNAQFDCVAASIGAALLYYEGKAAWDETINPDRLKDAAYGETYKGGTAASAYVRFCAALGYHLYALSGTPGYLITKAHEVLQAGHPVIFTEPDPYVSASLGWSHVCVFYAEESGFLTALDPYIAKPVKRTDSEWTNLLLFNQIWIVEPIQKVEEEMVTIDLNNPEVSKYFELASSDGASWRCRSNGKILQLGMLAFYKAFGNSELCGLTYLGLPQSNEIPMDSEGNTKQFFENGVLFYDPHHKYDTRPGTSNPETRPVYLAHLYSPNSPATDPRLAPLQAQVKELQAQLATETIVNPQAFSAMQAKMAQIKTIIDAPLV